MRTIVAVNRRKETLRTGCAADLTVGLPAPLLAGGESANWLVLALE